jgi:hypothetical protein
MKQHQPALSRLPGLEKQKKGKEKKKKTFSSLTSLFLHQIVTSHSQAKQTLLTQSSSLSSPSLNTFIFP